MATAIARTLIPAFLVLSALACQTQNDADICDPEKRELACEAGFKCDEIYTSETFLTCIPIEIGNADAGIIDAEPMSSPVDAKVDVPTPDAEVSDPVDLGVDVTPPECMMDKDCVGRAGGPVCTNGSCVPCTLSSQCATISATAPLCKTSPGLCVECLDDTSCVGKSGRPICNKVAGMCVKCMGASDCMPFAPNRPECAVDTGECVECTGNAGCAGKAGRPICDLNTKSCVKCGESTECATAKPALPVCALDSGDCVECLGHAHCRGKVGAPICSTASRSCVRCSASADCAAASPVTPICIVGTGECKECGIDTDCSDPAEPLCNAGVCTACDKAPGKSCDGRPNTPKTCDATTGRCEECVGNNDCTNATTPMCSNKKCIACKTDSECVTRNGVDPGICMASGACATDTDVIYAQDVAACSSSPGQGGTKAKPYCNTALAVGDATSIRNTVLVRKGTGTSIGGFTYAGVPSTLYVVGQNRPTLSAISQSAGILNLRNFVVTDNGNTIGVLVEGDATLNMDGLTVFDNFVGGIITRGVGQAYPNFDIRNTLVARNGVGLVDQPGGLKLEVGTGGIHRLTHVTVSRNLGYGLDCTGPVQMIGVIVSANNFTPAVDLCGTPTCCSGDPLLTSDYHLMAGSPCIDKVPANMSLPWDIDGNARPQGAASDCGADEFVP